MRVLILVLIGVAVSPAWAHDHTLANFQRQRATAKAANQQKAEPPPQEAENACRLLSPIL